MQSAQGPTPINALIASVRCIFVQKRVVALVAIALEAIGFVVFMMPMVDRGRLHQVGICEDSTDGCSVAIHWEFSIKWLVQTRS